jgi:hypothetical protein
MRGLGLAGAKLEPFWFRLKQFCFADGETIRAKAGARPMWFIGQAG